MDARLQQSQIDQKKRKRVSLPTTTTHLPATDREGSSFLCPVASCERSIRPFSQSNNMKRHILSRHPATTIPEPTNDNKRRRLELPRPEPINDNKRRKSERFSDDVFILESDIVEVTSPNPLACPVRGCTSSAAKGFSRLDNLKTHCRSHHPELDVDSLGEDWNYQHIRTLHPTSANTEMFKRKSVTSTLAATSTPVGVQAISSAAVRTSMNQSGLGQRGTLYFCPVAGCERVQGFTPYFNLQRHVRGKHPTFSLEDREPSNTKIYPSSTPQAQPVQAMGPFSTLQAQPVQTKLLNQDLRGWKGVITLPPVPPFEDLALDWEKALRTNSRPGEYAHHKHWDDLEAGTRTKYVGARMMRGKYGVTVPEPCSNCLRHKSECRVYHPGLPRDRGRSLGFACGNCKMAGQPCDVSRTPFDNYILRRAPADDEQTELHHSDEEIEGMTIDPKVRSGYCCPVQGCPNKDSASFARYVELQRHICTEHPNSNHALVLEAVYNSKPLVLHPPPSPEEFIADLELYATRNAAPGEFGHRPSHIWDNVQHDTQKRIAKARLIHEKYGVIAPQPCKGCHMRGTTCLALHPGLKNQLATTYCSECKNRSKSCHMAQDPFEPYLQRSQQNDRHTGPMDTIAGARRSPTKTNGIIPLGREIPDSDDVDVKLKDSEYDLENGNGTRGARLSNHMSDLRATPKSSRYGAYDIEATLEVPSPNYSDYPEFYDDEGEFKRQSSYIRFGTQGKESHDSGLLKGDSAPPTRRPPPSTVGGAKVFESAPPPNRHSFHMSTNNRFILNMSPSPELNGNSELPKNDTPVTMSESPLPDDILSRFPSNPSDDQDYRHYTKYSDQPEKTSGRPGRTEQTFTLGRRKKSLGKEAKDAARAEAHQRRLAAAAAKHTTPNVGGLGLVAAPGPNLHVNDITDNDLQRKVTDLMAIAPDWSVRALYDVLVANKGDYETSSKLVQNSLEEELRSPFGFLVSTPNKRSETEQTIPIESGETEQTMPNDGGETDKTTPIEGGVTEQTMPNDGETDQTLSVKGGETKQTLPVEGGETEQTTRDGGEETEQAAPNIEAAATSHTHYNQLPIPQGSAPTHAQGSASTQPQIDSRALQIMGPYINSPTVALFHAQFPRMNELTIRNLRHIVETVPNARTDSGVLLEVLRIRGHIAPPIHP